VKRLLLGDYGFIILYYTIQGIIIMERKCLNKSCKNIIPATANKAKKFCSDKCRMEFHFIGVNNFRNLNPQSKINTRQIGFISEMRAAIDLSFKGYEVFNSLYNASCDIIAMKDSKLIRIEVKTGFIKSGKLRTGAIKKGIYDILAIYDVVNDKIIYTPSLP